MFVTKSRFNELQKELKIVYIEYNKKLNDYHRLMSKHFQLQNYYEQVMKELDDLRYKKENRLHNFSQEDIKILLTLCHPDKHGGNPKANEITVKLLELRKK